MKKIMLGLMFAGMSLFAAASSGEPVKKVSKESDKLTETEASKELPAQYVVTYTCGNTTVTVCCFDYYIAAYLFLQDNPPSSVCPQVPQY